MSSARSHAVRFYGAVALGVTAVVVGVTLYGGRQRLAHGAQGGPEDTNELADWCPPGLDPIPGGCFKEAPGAPRPAPLLVYLHGRYAPEAAAEERERQARVARMATSRGYAVLALRGMQGQCSDPQLATWWCWPSNERNASDGPAFVARWEPALREVEQRIGRGRRVLLGFSNGGYFAAMIASRALSPFDAFAVAHAGPVQPMQPRGPAAPLLLIDADDDPSGPEMDRLDADLTRASWPHVMVAREGGHALPEWDVDMALTFFERTATSPLPLVPPLTTRQRRIHAEPDASAPVRDPDPDVPVPVPVPESSATAAPPDPARAPSLSPTPAAPAPSPAPVEPTPAEPAPVEPAPAAPDPAPSPAE